VPGGGAHTGKVSGAWVIRGTRVPVMAILESLKCSSIEEVLENFPGGQAGADGGGGEVCGRLEGGTGACRRREPRRIKSDARAFLSTNRQWQAVAGGSSRHAPDVSASMSPSRSASRGRLTASRRRAFHLNLAAEAAWFVRVLGDRVG
jgi:hypothetical protein